MVCWNGFGVIFGSEKHANNCRCSFHLPKTEVYRPDIVCLHCQFGVFLGGESLTKAGDLSHVLLIARRFSRQRHMSHVPFLVKEVQDPKLGWKLTSKGAKTGACCPYVLWGHATRGQRCQIMT